MAKKKKNRTKEQIIKRMNKVGYTTRFCNGSCPTKRVERVGEIDEEGRKVPFVMISNNNTGERYDWWSGETFMEELDVKGANLERLRTFFRDHSIYVNDAVGRVENPKVEKGELVCDVVFGTDEDSEKIFRKYVDGTLNDVSVGYNIRDIVVTEKKGEPTHVLVTEYDILELSAVGVGFDTGAGVRGAITKKKKKKKKSKQEQKRVKKDDEERGASVDVLQKKLKLKGN
jgi:hypothetical protein